MAAKKTDRDISEEKILKTMNGVAIWASFYRANPHRFAKDYLNITLKLFQQIILYIMNVSTHFMYLAARGQSKTFIIAIFCVIRCILYPGTRIAIVSKRRGQAVEVLDKIKTILMPLSDNLRSEIDSGDIVINQADAHIGFKNTSRIFVVTASDTSRHNRANIIVVDEFRMVPKDIIDTVIRPFTSTPRYPKYLYKKEFEHLAEQNKEIYASSCWYGNHWSYEKAKDFASNMMDANKKYFICGLPYQLSIAERLLDPYKVECEMSESTFNEISFSMEMECLFFFGGDGGLYSYDDITKNRKLCLPWYPNSIANKINNKRIRIPTKRADETRILSTDIALMSSNTKIKNDATSIFINSMLPSGSRYVKNIVYTENFEGAHTEDQALRIRQLFHEYDCDYLVIDCRGVGMGVTDLLLREQYDPQTGDLFPALTCCNNQEIAARCSDRDAPAVIWAIFGTSQLNSDCALGLRESLRQGLTRLLINEAESDEYLSSLDGYNKMLPIDKIELKMPYIHTSLLENELINLKYETKSGVIKVKEKSGMRKDRYSSLSYNIYVANEIEREKSHRKANGDIWDTIFEYRAPTSVHKNKYERR